MKMKQNPRRTDHARANGFEWVSAQWKVGGPVEGGGGAVRPRPGRRSKLRMTGGTANQTAASVTTAKVSTAQLAWNPAKAQGLSDFWGDWAGASDLPASSAGPCPVQMTRLSPLSGVTMKPAGIMARTTTAISAMANHALHMRDRGGADLMERIDRPARRPTQLTPDHRNRTPKLRPSRGKCARSRREKRRPRGAVGFEPEAYANLEFDWMAFVAAQGEFRRYKGDYVLTENDIRNHTRFNDMLIANDGSFCIHCAWAPGEGKYDFRLKDWIFDGRDQQSYGVPFRCLYSANSENLLMAGKHISVTHVAGSSVKLMGNGAQHGVATAAAAFLCNEQDTTPRGLLEDHLDKLRNLVDALTGHDHDMTSHPPARKFVAVPG